MCITGVGAQDHEGSAGQLGGEVGLEEEVMSVSKWPGLVESTNKYAGWKKARVMVGQVDLVMKGLYVMMLGKYEIRGANTLQNLQ